MFIRLLSFLLLLPAILPGADRPNVVVFLVDDMGIMDTSLPFLTDAQGKPVRHPLNEFYRTPQMEKLAAQGIRFNNFCAMSVCSPSRISIMTGQNAARHRTTNWIDPRSNNKGPKGPAEWNWTGLKKGDVTLPGVLRSAGYQTIHCGKGHLGPEAHEGANPLNAGFSVNVGGSAIGQPGSYQGRNNYRSRDGKFPNVVPGLEKYHGTDTFLTDALTIEASGHIAASVKAGKPFYLNLAHYAVHTPLEQDSRFASHYANSGRSPQAQMFATLIEGMDKSLGDLQAQLISLGVAEETLIFFLGDNGSDAPLGGPYEVACAAPLRGKKGSHYEGGTRVPFIAAWAKPNDKNPLQQKLPIPAGGIQSQLASVEDLFPTILHLCGAVVPQGHIVDGSRLDTLLSGKPDPSRKERFLMHYPHAPHRSDYWSSLRDGDWKVISHYFPSAASEGGHYQLFHLTEDPAEQMNLAEKIPAELRRMMGLLMAELESRGALYPVTEPGSSVSVKPQMPQ